MKITNLFKGLVRIANGDYVLEGDLISEENIEIELDDRLIVKGRIESKKSIIAKLTINAGLGINAGEGINAGTFIDVKKRIFAGTHVFHNSTDCKNEIVCKELRNGEIAYGKLIVNGKECPVKAPDAQFPAHVNCRCSAAVQPRYQIIIDCDGNTTTARMIVNGKEVKAAQAKRNPADKFNWKMGAQLAFDRLFGEPKKQPGVFHVGDRVVCTGCFEGNGNVNNAHGTIKRVVITGKRYAIEFDKNIHGHSLSGTVKEGHGWNVGVEFLRHE